MLFLVLPETIEKAQETARNWKSNKNRKVSESKNVSYLFIGYFIFSFPSTKYP